MKPAEILVMHRARIEQLYSENGSWARVYTMLSKSLPEIAGMSQVTFKQYAPILIELNKSLSNDEQLNNQVKQGLETVKQELGRLQELNSQLNIDEQLTTVKQELDGVKQQLNNDDRLNKVTQELEQVKQMLTAELDLNKLYDARLKEQVELNNELNNSIEQLKKQELNKEVRQDRVKQSLNIVGWSIQQSGGYYRGFRKIGGKMMSVYLGKSLDDAEQKIRAKDQLIAMRD
ncbi:MAG: hypothetical protein HY881_22865 [Deltaproteobacteria bacterium]|nr:hypothetical protein [Deltaproteobacteria bacterium]